MRVLSSSVLLLASFQACSAFMAPALPSLSTSTQHPLSRRLATGLKMTLDNEDSSSVSTATTPITEASSAEVPVVQPAAAAAAAGGIDAVIPPAAPVPPPPSPAAAKAAAKAAAAKAFATLEVQKAGATAPFGFFDPLGLSKGKTIKELKKWRESEVKHGRVAMLATVGVLVQEVFSPFYNPGEDFPGLSADPGPAAFHFQKLEAVNPFVLGYIGVLVAVLEAFTIAKGWDPADQVATDDIAGLRDDYLTGDLQFDPLNLAPRSDEAKFIEQRSKELNNGRLAMLAWAGMVVQEVVTGQKLFG